MTILFLILQKHLIWDLFVYNFKSAGFCETWPPWRAGPFSISKTKKQKQTVNKYRAVSEIWVSSSTLELSTCVQHSAAPLLCTRHDQSVKHVSCLLSVCVQLMSRAFLSIYMELLFLSASAQITFLFFSVSTLIHWFKYSWPCVCAPEGKTAILIHLHLSLLCAGGTMGT